MLLCTPGDFMSRGRRFERGGKIARLKCMTVFAYHVGLQHHKSCRIHPRSKMHAHSIPTRKISCTGALYSTYFKIELPEDSDYHVNFWCVCAAFVLTVCSILKCWEEEKVKLLVDSEVSWNRDSRALTSDCRMTCLKSDQTGTSMYTIIALWGGQIDTRL